MQHIDFTFEFDYLILVLEIATYIHIYWECRFIQVMRDAQGYSKGFGFVAFLSSEDAARAVS